MTELKDKSVVITGASSGIGAATARLLAQRGAYVFLGARRTERLEHLVAEIRLEGGKAEFLRVDVTQLEDVQRLVDLAEQTCGHLDVVVNNAGVMPLSALELLKVGEWNRMIDVNIRGVLHGIAAGLPIMKRQGYGQFVNVSSIGAHRVSPTAAVYCATKFAVNAISEGLRQENDRIRVTIISPGVTESELAESISDIEARAGMVEYRKVAISAESVARAILYAVTQPEDVNVSELIVQPTASNN